MLIGEEDDKVKVYVGQGTTVINRVRKHLSSQAITQVILQEVNPTQTVHQLEVIQVHQQSNHQLQVIQRARM